MKFLDQGFQQLASKQDRETDRQMQPDVLQRHVCER